MSRKSNAILSSEKNANFNDGGEATAAEFRAQQQDMIDSKAHLDVTDALSTEVAGKANTVHTHALSDITDAGTAAAANTGTSAGNVPVLDGSGRLPAVDGSQLTGLAVSAGTGIVDTIADLKAITPTPGAAVTVLGYLTPGDGGGGLFLYSNAGEASDGAMVFHATEDETAEVVTVVSTSGGTSLDSVQLGADIAWGSVSMELDTTIPVTLTDVLLHGHQPGDNTDGGEFVLHPTVDYSIGLLNYLTGEFKDRARSIRNRMPANGGTQITFRRKNITDTRRWKRAPEDPSVFRLSWMGFADGDVQGSHYLCWATNLVRRFDFPVLDLDGRTVLQSGIIDLPIGRTTRNGTLKTRGGDWAGRIHKTTPLYDNSDPEFFVDQMLPWTTVEPSSIDGLETTIELSWNGNFAENSDVLNNPGNYTGGNGPTIFFRNSPYCSGWSYFDQNGRSIPEGRVVMPRVSMKDMHANCFAGNFKTHYDVGHCVLENSAYNHLIYGVQGTIDHLEMRGYASFGTYGKSERLKIGYLEATTLYENPYEGTAGQIFTYEGGDYGDNSLVEPSRFDYPGLIIERATVALPDGAVTPLSFGFHGDHMRVGSVTYVTDTALPGGTLFLEIANSPQGMNKNYRIDGVTYLLRNPSSNGNKLMGPNYIDQLEIKGVDIRAARGFSGFVKGSVSNVAFLNPTGASFRGDPVSGEERSVTVDGVRCNDIEMYSIIRCAEPSGADAVPINCLARNINCRVGDNLIVGMGGATSGTLNVLPDGLIRPDLYKISWEDSHLTMGGFTNSFLQFSGFLGTAKRMTNVTMETSQSNAGVLRSEADGSVSFLAAGGETSVSIPTTLLWVPKGPGNVVLSPKSADAAVALRDHFISFRNRADTFDLEWDFYPGRDLVGSRYQWTLSGSGTSEYYLELAGGGDPALPRGPSASFEYINEGGNVYEINDTLGALTAGQSAFGDNDSLGFDTIYVRLSDSASPSSKASGDVRYIVEQTAAAAEANRHQPMIKVNFATALTVGDDITFDWAARVI